MTRRIYVHTRRRWPAGDCTMIRHSTLLALLVLALCGTATAQTTRGFVAVNGGLQSGSKGFSQDRLVDSPLFGPEDGTLTARHPGGNATVFDVSAGARLWRQLGVGVGVSRLSRSETVGLTGQLPHPFRFDRPRAVDGTEAGVASEETALHVHARWGIPVSQSVEVALFGGPTFFSVSQAFVTGIDFDQAYPYDTATLTSAMTRTQDGSTIGFNVGADIAVYFSRWVGVGGLIRFSRSKVDLGDSPTTIAVGGLHTAAGLRLRF